MSGGTQTSSSKKVFRRNKNKVRPFQLSFLKTICPFDLSLSLMSLTNDIKLKT
jgi:hypothetical protein